MRLRSIVFMLVAAAALAGCAREAPRYVIAAQPAAAASDLDALMYGAPPPASLPIRRVAHVVPAPVVMVAPREPYTLDAGDKLRIVVFGQESLTNTYIVDAEGKVTMPLIGGVMARANTTAQLAAAITARLKQSFIRDPSVAVEIETYRPFFVLGEVTFPGQYPYVPQMTVETAIAIAGGFTARAYKWRVRVTRKLDGEPAWLNLPLNAPLRPGDTITVEERWF